MVPTIKDLMSVSGSDAVAPMIRQGPYGVIVLPAFGFVVGYFQEEEPIDDDELEDAWARLELAVPAIRDTSLARVMEHHKDGKTLVLELYVH